MSVSLYDGRVRLAGTLRVWALAYLGNLLGILVLCLLLARWEFRSWRRKGWLCKGERKYRAS